MMPMSTTASLQVVNSSYPNTDFIEQYTIAFTRQREKEKKGQGCRLTKAIFRHDASTPSPSLPSHRWVFEACITEVEGLAMPGHVLYQAMEFFEGVGSDPAMSDNDVISTSKVTFLQVAMKAIP